MKKGTTFSDRELETWATAAKKKEAIAFWERGDRGFDSTTAIGPLAGEALELRRILRGFLARYEPTSHNPLVLRAVDHLGMNLEATQPLFPSWPKPDGEDR